MTKHEKVIKGLECCIEKLDTIVNRTHGFNCTTCPYYQECEAIHSLVGLPMARDALALLKAQEPRVMTLEELPTWDGAFLIEARMNGETVWASWYSEYELYDQTICRMQDIDGEVDDRFKKLYGYEWRCWTSRPDEKTMEATPWE